MCDIVFKAIPTADARHFQESGLDAYGRPAEIRVSDGDGVPCRHCLRNVEKGEAYLVLAYRPFSSPQPYAETGPIFLHAERCARAEDQPAMPAQLAKREQHLLRAYDADERIIYGTGSVVPTSALAQEAAALLDRPEVSFLHVRSAKYNCFTCRIDRAA
jgi:hypothetical protein